MRRPEPTEHVDYFNRYISLVPETDVVAGLVKQSDETQQFIAELGEQRAAHRYAPDKWSMKGVIGHVADGEHVFGYRLLAIARGDEQSLPGFDEGDYAKNANFDDWPLRDLSDYLAHARQANLRIIRNLRDADWDRRGVANENPITVRALAFTMLGHERHHLRVLRERYL